VRKIFIDCGANRGQSIDLFIKSWPDSKEYEIFSFEANKDFEQKLEKEKKFWDNEGYNVNINVPVAVWDKDTDGELNLFGEDEHAVVTDKPSLKRTGLDPRLIPADSGEARWLVAYNVIEDPPLREFKPKSIRLSTWILNNFSKDDYIVLKLDVEGSEYRIIEDLKSEKAFGHINEFYYEFHGPKKGFTYKDDIKALNTIRQHGITPYSWNGNVSDFKKKEVHEIIILDWYNRKGFET